MSRCGLRPLLVLACAGALATGALAERLPWSVLDTSHGLAGDSVRNLYQDSRGFLWIGTSSGLSRYDGETFRNYDTKDGLPAPRIEGVAETPDGSIWVATSHGVARLRPDASAVSGPAFVVEPLPEPLGAGAVDYLWVDRSGALWAARAAVLARFRLDAGGRLEGGELSLPELGVALAFEEGDDGTLWLGGSRGLVRWPNGDSPRFVAIGSPGGLAPGQIEQSALALAVDGAGRLWIATAGLVLSWLPEPIATSDPTPLVERSRRPHSPGDLPSARGEIVRFGPEEGLPSPYISELIAEPRGVWAATRAGLFFVSSDGRSSPRTISSAEGLPELNQFAALVDRDGALWFGSESRGLSRLTRTGFVAYGTLDGLAGDRVATLFEDPPGELNAISWSRDLHRFDGERFHRITPRALDVDRIAGWGWNQFIQRDRRGRLWYPTGRGLYRFGAMADPSRLPEALPERHWAAGTGLPGDDVFRVYEDRAGDVWVSTISTPCLTRFEGGERPTPVPEVEPCTKIRGSPTAFAEDRDGNLWIGFYVGHLARVRRGEWRFFTEADGVPPGFVGDLFVDRKGRLWIATANGGVARVDDPGAERPLFRRTTSADGLVTDATRCVTEDAAGRIYVGGSRGVDRFDPESGRVRSYSTVDGLPNSIVPACHAASDGTLWFGTLHGLARFVPPPDEAPRPSRVRLTGVRVAGLPLALPDLGVESIAGVELGSGRRSLEVEFGTVAFEDGRNVRFEHRVLGADERWSAPSQRRSVGLAALSAGSYRFEVRAVTGDGVRSANVAGFDFAVLRPFWQRPWFAALAAALALVVTLAVARMRTARLVAVERARTRIAADLHDDVGSSVSRIGLLGELARRRVRGEPEAAETILGEIGEEASALAEATSDIVWSVDPRRDDLGSLVVRLRRFAADLLEAKEIALDFAAPENAAEVALSPEVRRALYLTMKEAIHNVAKHSGAARARVAIALEGGEVRAEVSDDGRGIDAERAKQAFAEGRHGLGGMVARAAEAAGEARIEPAPGGGTRVTLRFPAGRRRPAGSHGDAISKRGAS